MDEESKKLEILDSLIEAAFSKKELITYETELSQVISWDESWGGIGLFHKSQRIKFFGVGIYVCDLGMLTQDSIQVDLEGMTVYITVPSPVIKGVNIDEGKTQYEDTDRGWLRFGGIKLTSEQYNSMYGRVKASMEKQLKEPGVIAKAQDGTRDAVRSVMEEILGPVGDFTVRVYLEQGQLY